MKYFTILLCSIILWINGVYSDDTTDIGSSLFCMDLRPQSSLNIERMMGMWYGKEIITHHDTDKIDLDFDACVVIHLTEVTHEMSQTRPRRPDGADEYVNRQVTYYDYNNNRIARPSQYHYLRLTWVENDLNLEYTLRYNTSRPGFWISSSPQKGTMTKLNYNQFSGTIQVMKVVGDHMVLTFCQSLPGSQLFTIVVSREPKSLTVDDLQSIRALLQQRGLSTTNVRRVCNDANGTIQFSIIALIAPIILTIGLKNLI